MSRLLLLAVLFAGCRAPLDAPDVSSEPTACTVGGVSLLDIARAGEQADLVVTARTLRALPASRFVQSPPPAPGDTVRLLVTAEVTAAYGPSAPGERIDYQFTVPFAPDWEKNWAEGSEWTAWLAARDGRVPWQAIRAPLPVTTETDSLLADGWPHAGLRFTPSVTVERIAGGVPEASGYMFSFKTEDGTPVRIRLTDLDAPMPALWAQPQGLEVWQQIRPCSLAGARLHLALPNADALGLDEERSAAFGRLEDVLRGGTV